MLTLVCGPNSSGKSLYAESLCSGDESLCYIATLLPAGEVDTARIAKHRAQREGLGFTTLELPYRICDANIPPDATVLLEDVSNLLANLMFEPNAPASDAFDEIAKLASRCKRIVAVTITGLSASAHTGETREYIMRLDALNARLFEFASTVYEMQNGVPVLLKGEGACV